MFDIDLAKYGNKVCLITEDQTYTYNQVEAYCQKLEEKLPPFKSLFLVQASTCIDTIIIYLSLLRKGHAFILDASDNPAFTKVFIKTYNPNFIWTKKEPGLEYITEFGVHGLIALHSKQLDLHPDLSLMLSTSGSTGSPKLVRLSKKCIYTNCKSITKYLNISSDHTTVTNLPLSYSYGLSVLNTHLNKGASILVTDSSIMSKDFWELCRTHCVTTLNGVPYNYEIFKRIGLTKMDLPCLRFMTQAGGKLSQTLVKEFSQWAYEKNIHFFVMYGQTEATARISYLPPEKTLDKHSSIGVAIPGGELSLYSSDHKLITASFTEGELVYKGNNVMLGYATKLADLAKADELNGTLYTGDLAQRDEEGYFYITGRLKRFIKLHGNRVNLDEIEHHLKSRSYDVLCTGLDNTLMIATLEQDRIDEIKKELIKAFKFHHTTIKVICLDDYPISHSGKTQYQELLKAFQ